jgi:hypothetical protein
MDYTPMTTFDTDVAVPAQLPVVGQTIQERLLERNFHEDRLGDARPPATHYRLVTAESGFYAEFLTPLEGGEYKRGGKRDTTARIAGVSSQKLRYIDLLLAAPWAVKIGAAAGYPTPDAMQVLVPNPASYLAQKVLIRERRLLADRARDVLYIHDTFEAFGGSLAAICIEWETHVRPILPAKATRLLQEAAKTLFAEVNDTIREAALIDQGRGLTPEKIREVCSYGWKQVFV